MQEKVYYRWGEREEEEDVTKLPKSWEARVAADSRVFFLK